MSSGLRSPALEALGLEHGLAVIDAEVAAVGRLATVRQVHGARLLPAHSPGPGAEADAVYTREPGLAVGVVTADCVPLLLVDRERSCVAAIHAGWRGTAAGIAHLATTALCAESDIPAERFTAVVGPHIGPCCYEVDAPVRAAIDDAAAFRDTRPGHYRLDLFLVNRAQLMRAGIHETQIHRVGGCTFCDSARRPSYRRDRTSGRMLHYVRMPS